MDYPPPLPTKVATNSTSSNCEPLSAMLPTAMPPPDYAMDLLLLKNEINQLKTIIVMAVELIKHAIVSLQDTHGEPMSNAMDTKANHSVSSNNMTVLTQPTRTQLDLPAIIKELKNNIATITQVT